jgi:predicted metal-dependent hydrolase
MTSKKAVDKKERPFVKMTGLELEEIASNPGLSKLLERELSAPWPYWLEKMLDHIQREMKHYGKASEDLSKKHARKNSKGDIIYSDEAKTTFDIDPRTIEKYREERQALRETIIEFTFRQMDKTLLEFSQEIQDEDSIKIPAIELRSIRHFFNSEEN